MNNTIDVEATKVPAEPETPVQSTALQVRPQQMAVGKALSLSELHERLEFVRQVMKQEMKEDQDFGKIPGTGDKPSLLQPGAQKLLMTFSLREQVKREVMRELPHPSVYGHREYEITISVFPAGLRPDDGWDGVGTCSTFESKYRYRKAERRCPKCGKATIISEKPEYTKGREPGFVCWKKKGGCGELFHKEHPDITKQSAEDVENEDPADCWNTVRKMAFKRALVAAAINATNTSELWTQDVEDMVENRGSGMSQPRPSAPPPRSAQAPKAPPKPAPPPQPVKNDAPPPKRDPQPAIFADQETRNRMIAALADCRDLAVEYFSKLTNPTLLLPNEGLEDVPLPWVPVTKGQMKALLAAITDFGNGSEAKHPYAPNPEPPAKNKPAAPPPAKLGEKPPAPSVAFAQAKDPEWFWDVVCPIPQKGMKRDVYLQNPDTIGSMYHEMKTGNEAMQKRLWGFARHWQPEPRTVGNKTYQPSEADKVFRQALDAFVDWEEKHGRDTDAEPSAEPPRQDPPVQRDFPDDEDDLPM